jgi:FkbM family methyltransferase
MLGSIFPTGGREGILRLVVRRKPESAPGAGLLSRVPGRLLDSLRRKRKRRAGRRWTRDGGDERWRYSYDLGPDSLVVDCGAYLGDFAEDILRRHACAVLCFEPVPEYFARLSARFAHQPRVSCFNCGLGASPRLATIGIAAAASSLFDSTAALGHETIRIIGLDQILELAGPRDIDLLKLNIEGGEFELLEAILARQMATRFRHIQVQFHQVVPDFHARWCRIRAGLAETHRLTYDYYFVWENWSRGPAQSEPVGQPSAPRVAPVNPPPPKPCRSA